jgi:AcrR family transcriptional regulator
MIHENTVKTSRRERNRQQRIQEILDTSLVIIEAEGLEALTIQRLAKDMGWAMGAVYRYYSSKDALLAAVERQAIRIFRDELALAREHAKSRLAGDESGATALALLLWMSKSYLRLSQERRGAFRLMSLMLGDPNPVLSDEETAAVLGAMMPLLEDIALLFEEAETAFALDHGEAMERTILFWLAGHGVIQTDKLSRVGNTPFNTEPMLDEMAATLLKGWGAQDVMLWEASQLVRNLQQEKQ